jgi:hypothetical protein
MPFFHRGTDEEKLSQKWFLTLAQACAKRMSPCRFVTGNLLFSICSKYFVIIQGLSKLGKSPETQGIAEFPVIHTCGETCG